MSGIRIEVGGDSLLDDVSKSEGIWHWDKYGALLLEFPKHWSQGILVANG